MDESWVNAGHTCSKVWKDTTVKTKNDAWQKGLTTGLNDPSGKGEILIILPAGSDSGFVQDGLLVFQGINQGDYHIEMNGDVFEDWFKNTFLLKLCNLCNCARQCPVPYCKHRVDSCKRVA